MRETEKLIALTSKSDEELMRLFQEGTVDAFEILVGRYTQGLSLFIYPFIRDNQAVEDLRQETFIRVYRNRHSYKPIAKFSTWLYTIARNLALSEWRRRKRQRTFSLYAMNQGDDEYEIPISNEMIVAPDRYTDSSIQHRRLLQALEQIPENFREIVVLCDLHELSYEEIVTITGLPMGTVKSRINRGRTRLQELLADSYESN